MKNGGFPENENNEDENETFFWAENENRRLEISELGEERPLHESRIKTFFRLIGQKQENGEGKKCRPFIFWSDKCFIFIIFICAGDLPFFIFLILFPFLSFLSFPFLHFHFPRTPAGADPGPDK